MFEKRVYDALDRIKGEKVSDIGRCANMLWLAIGNTYEGVDWKGNAVEKCVFALHIQCEWRVVNRERKEILFAMSDFYSPNSSLQDETDFEWDIQGNNLFDEKSKLWLREASPVYVEDYSLNSWGDLHLFFSNGDRLDLFVDSSDNTEAWRLFDTTSSEPHLVFTDAGYEF